MAIPEFLVDASQTGMPSLPKQALRILVIDDDEFISSVIKFTLESCGHSIQLAENGMVGLDRVRDFDPQIVLIDWMMPAMDGVEVVRRIRQMPEGRFRYLMIMTQHDNEALLVNAFEAGVDDFVIKPITSRALTARISAGERLLRLEAQVERERRDSHRYLDTVDVMILGLDTEGNITLANRKACDILGYSERSLLGRNWFGEFVADTGKGLKWADYDAVTRNNVSTIPDYENIITIRDGAKRLISWNNSVITHDDKVAGFLSCGNDITERRQAADEREKLAKQLLQAQKAQAIGNLVGGITHNFNNILASIIGYTELSREIMAGKKDDSITLFLEQAYSAALEAKKFIATLETINDGNQQDNQDNQLPLLAPLLEDVSRMVAPLVGPNIKLTVKVDDDIPSVSVNPDNINQMVTQLCINAREAMKNSGEITLGLSHYRHLQGVCASCYNFFEGEFVSLCVVDSGPGISLDTLESIFAPFFTSKPMVIKEDGLGLPLVHGIMHGCHGHIVVDTEIGKGASFSLLFPVAGVAEN